MTVIVAYCRAGFEAEALADLASVATAAGTTISGDAATGTGFVVARPRVFDAQRWPRALEAAPPVFVRALFFGTGPHVLFDPAIKRGRPDRVAPLATLVRALRRESGLPGVPHAQRSAMMFSELRVEMPDTNDGKALSGVCRGVDLPLAAELLADGALAEADDAHRGRSPLPVLHVFFVSGAEVYLGVSAVPWGSAYAMGIPRLHLPRGAPSRSTLKLAEAIAVFLGDREGELLHAGMKAVDLGAAPGGWTWQLAQRGLRVIAVDNGSLKGDVADDPRVNHQRVDGLSYLPRRPVDWMVCDMVEQPSRIATLVGRWLAEGHARRSIFNLKLPMKKRHAEMLRCRAIIDDALSRTHARHRLQLRQLYHDREEITGFVERIG